MPAAKVRRRHGVVKMIDSVREAAEGDPLYRCAICLLGRVGLARKCEFGLFDVQAESAVEVARVQNLAAVGVK